MNITGRHMTVTPALRRHIRQRFARLERYGVRIDQIRITVEVSKLRHAAEAVCASGGKRFQAKISTPEMYVSIDELVGRLEAQLRKHKEKRTNHKPRKASRRSLPPPPDEAETKIEIVRPRLSVLSREAATSELDSRLGSVMVFTCADSGKLQVLHRAKNGRIVLIDP